MRNCLGAIGLILAIQSPVFAEDFYLKLDDANVIKTPIDMTVGEKDAIKFAQPERLSRFLLNDLRLPDGWIVAEEPSDVEKAVDATMMLLTSLLIMGTHQSYHLNSELRISAYRGLIFLIFPFEDYYLYADCGGESYLVASSSKPSEDSLKRMKTLKEVRALCGIKDDSAPSNKVQS